MIRINKKTEYALMVLSYLYKKQDMVSGRDLSIALNIPFDPLSKALQKLSHLGVVKAEQGTSGGYQLNHDLNQVNLYTLVEAVEGRSFEQSCEQKACEHMGCCTIKAPIENLQQYLGEIFKGITVADVLT